MLKQVWQENTTRIIALSLATSLLVACGGGGGGSSGGGAGSAAGAFTDSNTISWSKEKVAGAAYRIYYSANPAAVIEVTAAGVTGADGDVPLSFDLGAGSANYVSIPEADPHYADVRAAAISGKLMVVAIGASGKPILDADGKPSEYSPVPALVPSTLTAQQLDAIFVDGANGAQSKTLGVTFDAMGKPTFSVWSPPASSVKLHVYTDATGTAEVAGSPFAMTMDAVSGVWSYAASDASWRNTNYYKYEVAVGGASNLVTDPYSVSLNANGLLSFVADLNDASLKPTGWDASSSPANITEPEDISIYELHVRDFSASDMTVTEANRGKFLAFTETTSNGMKHLKALQAAGLTTVQFLPINDISSVNEGTCTTPAISAPAAGDSDAPQTVATASKETDCFNWGYDPQHYSAPEGSYSTDANDGKKRIIELRRAVKSLHDSGLRVTIDVVYNHTPFSGADPKEVLDKIVPKYYHRYNADGTVANSTCCSNTATENKMMAKLMIDSVANWASAYKLDGFRFDLMGHQPKAVMVDLQTKVNAAAGRPLYYYGEGWNFGEVADDKLFVQATQKNMAGTGIGTFSDRARDSIRGGGPFDSGLWHLKNQGFINGLFYDDNGSGSGATVANLNSTADMVRLGFAGTLKDYSLLLSDDTTKKGSEIVYGGSQAAGYAADPQEIINYVDKHDNETLFDINTYKLPATTSPDDRVRVQNLGSAFGLLAQGVPFFQAGSDILRSKSMDRNSYNSGDWFNRLDWTYTDNNFGVGAPPAADNTASYAQSKPFLADAKIKMGNKQITDANAFFRDMLKVRYSSTLFRMRTGADVMSRLKFYNTGSTQQSALVVFSLDGSGYTGANFSKIVVLYNVDKVAKTFSNPDFVNAGFTLHSAQASGSDAEVKKSTFTNATGSFMVPARSVAVFVVSAS